MAGLAVGYGLSIPLVEAVGPLILLTALGIAWHSRGLLPPVLIAGVCALSFVLERFGLALAPRYPAAVGRLRRFGIIPFSIIVGPASSVGVNGC